MFFMLLNYKLIIAYRNYEGRYLMKITQFHETMHLMKSLIWQAAFPKNNLSR